MDAHIQIDPGDSVAGKTTKKPKVQLGRPVMGEEAKQRYQVMLEPSVAEKLRRIGGDNLSAGIAKAAEGYRK